MSGYKAGCSGIGYGGETKYGAEGAPVKKNGGNSAMQNGKRTEASPESLYKKGPYGKAGAAAQE